MCHRGPAYIVVQQDILKVVSTPPPVHAKVKDQERGNVLSAPAMLQGTSLFLDEVKVVSEPRTSHPSLSRAIDEP